MPPSHVSCETPPLSCSFSWYLWISTSVLLGFPSHSSVLSIAQFLAICPKYAMCGSRWWHLLWNKLGGLMKNEQQKEHLLLKVDQHSPFHNNFLQPATNCWSHKVKKCKTSIQNLQQNTVVWQVEGFCISYFATHVYILLTWRFGVCMYQLVTFWLPNLDSSSGL